MAFRVTVNTPWDDARIKTQTKKAANLAAYVFTPVKCGVG
jgi:hypothetical protein